MEANHNWSVFLFIDVDGYGQSGIDSRLIVGRDGIGYRPRELGWAYFAIDPEGRIRHETSSVFFVDDDLPLLDKEDPCVVFTRAALHGLPVHPRREDFLNQVVFRSDELLDVISLLGRSASKATGAKRVVYVHKGGPESFWIPAAVPGAMIIELGTLGCPKADLIGKCNPAWMESGACILHGAGARPGKRRKGGIVHCPRLEVKLLSLWLGHTTAVITT